MEITPKKCNSARRCLHPYKFYKYQKPMYMGRYYHVDDKDVLEERKPLRIYS